MKRMTGKYVFVFLFLLFVLPNVQVKANTDLDEMLDIRTSDTSQMNEVNEITERLGSVGDRILEQLNATGARIILTDESITNLPEFEYLQGLVPDGWEDTGLTWDDVPGVGSHTSAVRMGYSDYGEGHSSVNLELHEFAHTVDDYVTDVILSHTDDFRGIMTIERDDLFYDHAVAEYFDDPAEYLSAGTDSEKEEGNTKQTKGNGRLVMTWTDQPDASVYVIYTDDKKIGEVESGQEEYIIEDLTGGEHYAFYVRAFDDNDDLITARQMYHLCHLSYH